MEIGILVILFIVAFILFNAAYIMDAYDQILENSYIENLNQIDSIDMTITSETKAGITELKSLLHAYKDRELDQSESDRLCELMYMEKYNQIPGQYVVTAE
jgi:hypothetical protein